MSILCLRSHPSPPVHAVRLPCTTDTASHRGYLERRYILMRTVPMGYYIYTKDDTVIHSFAEIGMRSLLSIFPRMKNFHEPQVHGQRSCFSSVNQLKKYIGTRRGGTVLLNYTCRLHRSRGARELIHNLQKIWGIFQMTQRANF